MHFVEVRFDSVGFFVAPLIAIAAVALHVTLYHLWVGLRDRSRKLDLTFAAMSFASACYSFASALRFGSTSPELSMLAARFIDTIGLSVAPLLFLFIQRSTGVGSDRAARGCALGVIALLVAASFAPFGWLEDPKLEVHEVSILGRSIEFLDTRPRPLVRGLQLVAIGLALFGNVLVFLGVRRSIPRAAPLCAAMLICDAAIVHDLLVERGVIATPYMLVYAYVALLVVMTITLSEDVLRAARAEQALRVSEDRLAMAVTGSNDGLFDWDLERGHAYYTPKFAELLGVPPEKLVSEGPLPEALLSLGGVVDLRGAILARIEDGMPLDVELERPTPDGLRWLRLRGQRVGERGSGRRRFAGSLSDVTERRRAELRLATAERVESIGRLAGGVAHDFNNMLAGLLAFGELIRADPGLSERSRFAVERILEAGRRATELTTRLLAFSRRGTTRATPVDVHRAIEEALSLLERTIDPRITIERHFDARYGTVVGDRAQLQSAILNLGVNARDAMKEGGRLRIATSNVALDEDQRRSLAIPSGTPRHVVVEVSDDGPGIPRAVLDHILEPYFTTKAPGEGTGLGLTSVAAAVDSMHGKMVIDSEVGRGTTVRLYLPVSDAVSESVAPPARVTERSYAGVALVVDDENVVREAIRTVVETMGLDVVACADGIEAKRALEQHRWAVVVVVMDLVMPKQSAEETFRSLRQIAPDVPVILISAFDSGNVVPRLIEAGASSYVAKPFQVHELMDAVASALDARTEAELRSRGSA